MEHDQRYQKIHQWLQSIWHEEEICLKPLKGDCSFRRYYRLNLSSLPKSSYIVMDSPPEHEPVKPFIKTSQYLAQRNLPVPQIHHQDIKLGALVLDDFGHNDLFHLLTPDNVNHYYTEAIDHIITLQNDQIAPKLPLFDQEQIQTELVLFTEWFLQKHCQQTIPALDDEFNYLQDIVLNAPQTIVHRDYHSKNLMIKHDGTIGILDHQDLMIGPISYDLVSLIKDCYIDWPPHQVNEWLAYFCEKKGISADSFLNLFEITGVQRHLKACGIFARQAHLYNNPNYLQFIPRTLKYIEQVTDRNNNLTGLARLIKKIQ